MIKKQWKKTPILLKMVLSIIFIWRLVSFVNSMMEFTRTTKNQLQRKLEGIQFELQKLLIEKKRTQILIMNVRSYSKVLMIIFKSICATFLVLSAALQMIIFNMDFLTALITACGTVGTTYFLTRRILNIKINNMKDFDSTLSKMIDLYYSKQMLVEPERLNYLKNRE